MVNFIRTGALIAALTALFMAVGYFIGGSTGMLIAFVVAVGTNLFAYWNSDRMVLAMQNAHEVSPESAPDLYALVERLSQRAGIPMPRVYLIDTAQPNAFATGRNPEHAAVAVSSGLLQTLEPHEIAGVIAHELGHIRSRDTLTMTITGTLAGAIAMLAQFGLFFGGGNRNNPLGGIGALAMVFLAPLAAGIVQMAISRTREYQADRDGAEISGEPLALASALSKISRAAGRNVNVAAEKNPAMAHIYIFNPLSGQRMDNLFATHPDVGNRIAELERIAADMNSTTQGPSPSGTTEAKSAAGRPRGPWDAAPGRQIGAPDTTGRQRGASNTTGRQRGPWG